MVRIGCLPRLTGWRATRLAFAVIAAWGAALIVSTASAVEPAPARGAAAPAHFWDDCVRLRDLSRQDPDSASGESARLLGGDPDHFLGAWLRGQVLATARPDSQASARLVARADREPDRAGLQVSAATVLFARGEPARGRAALRRAHDAYSAARRPTDACRALYWILVLGRGAHVGPEARADLREAETAARALGDPEALADVLLTRAEMEYRENAQAALQTRLEALGLLTALPPGYQLIECHRHLSNAYKTVGDLAMARHHGERALALARSLGYPRQELMALRAVAHVDRAEGALLRAREAQSQAVTMARQLRESEVLARSYGDLANLERDMGRYREAKQAYQLGLRSLGPAGGDPGFRAMILDGLAAVDCRLGDFRDARARYEEALAVCRARGLQIRVPQILADLAQLHLDTGEAQRALEIASEGIDAADSTGNRRAQVSLMLLKSRALQELGQGEAALAAARGGRRSARDGVPHLRWEMMRREADVLAALGRWRAADALLDSATTLTAQESEPLELAACQRLQGEVRARAGEPARALPPLRSSLELLRRMREPLQTAHARLVLGGCLLDLGRAAEALDELTAGLRELETARSSFSASVERSGFAATWYAAYADLARAQLALGRPEAAFATLESSRGRGLRESLALGSAGLRTHVPGELGERLATVESELAGIQSAVREESTQEASESSAWLPGLERRADSLKTVWSDLAARVEREAPEFARALGRLPTVTAGEVRAALRRGECLVAYLVGANETLAFTFTPKRFAARAIPWGEAAVASRVAACVTALREDSPDSWRALAAALADTLFEGGVLPASAARALYVLPDGALHLLPFEALLVVDPADGKRVCLMEQTPVVYASSATLLLRSPPARGSARAAANDVPLVAFGDPALVAAQREADVAGGTSRGALAELRPLPHARREVEALPRILPGTRVFVGEQATEGRFWTEARHAGMVHVAAHAFVDDRHPEFSGIVLSPSDDAAGDGGDDGILQAYEVAGHSLDLSLVTLSACESGAGRLLRGEGLLSLARAFRLMGAHNLVVSLWKVDDATTMRFMVEFYTRLATGEPAGVALRGAKLALFRSTGEAQAVAAGAHDGAARGVGRHPLDEQASAPAGWAPFVLVGERVPLVGTREMLDLHAPHWPQPVGEQAPERAEQRRPR